MRKSEERLMRAVIWTTAIVGVSAIGAWGLAKLAGQELLPSEKPRDPPPDSPDEMFDVDWDELGRSART